MSTDTESWFRCLCWLISPPPPVHLPHQLHKHNHRFVSPVSCWSVHSQPPPLQRLNLYNVKKKKKDREACPHFGWRGVDKISGRGKSPNVTYKGDKSGIKAKFSLSSRVCLQGVKRGDNGNRDGPTDRKRQPRGASLACHLSSQTTRNNKAAPAVLSKVKAHKVLALGMVQHQSRYRFSNFTPTNMQPTVFVK